VACDTGGAWVADLVIGVHLNAIIIVPPQNASLAKDGLELSDDAVESAARRLEPVWGLKVVIYLTRATLILGTIALCAGESRAMRGLVLVRIIVGAIRVPAMGPNYSTRGE